MTSSRIVDWPPPSLRGAKATKQSMPPQVARWTASAFARQLRRTSRFARNDAGSRSPSWPQPTCCVRDRRSPSARSAASVPECRSRNWCRPSIARRSRPANARPRRWRRRSRCGRRQSRRRRSGRCLQVPSADLPDSSRRRWSSLSASAANRFLTTFQSPASPRRPDEQAGLDAVARQTTRRDRRRRQNPCIRRDRRRRSISARIASPQDRALSANR